MFDKLQHALETENFVALHDYMAWCNAHYYSHRPAIGAAGDFITAPEISQLFGELLGIWVISRWNEMGQPKYFNLIELGPGRGTLMADMLRLLRQIPDVYNAVEIHLYENSSAMRAEQKSALADHNKTIHWHDDLHKIPTAPFIVIANEFFDALPIQQFVYSIGGWLEVGVQMRDGKLVYATREITDAQQLKNVPQIEIPPVPGNTMENCPSMENYLDFFLRRMQEQPGSALFIDYGYNATTYGDTFQAVAHHAFADPLENPGAQDLTAHVNFGMIKEFAQQQHLHCAGPIGQGEFLQNMGIQIRAEKLLAQVSDPQEKFEITSGVHRLTAADEMGNLFKVICLSSPTLLPPEGFHAS